MVRGAGAAGPGDAAPVPGSARFRRTRPLDGLFHACEFLRAGERRVGGARLYMKKQHGLGMKRYLLASLLYYACYAVVSAFMLLIASRPWWQTCLGLAVAGSAAVAVVRWYAGRSAERATALDLNVRSVCVLLLATLLQACVQVAVYGFELYYVDPGVRPWQAVTYTGAANFSLFVALTPGAIGIRETFLYFSEQLHHIDTAAIIAASVIDRVVFLLLLGLLFLSTVAFHAKRALRLD